MRVLVVGGAGYIGSHMVKLLLDRGLSVTTLDNFVTGHRDAILGGEVIEGDIGDRPLLDRVFSVQRYDCVMHFASFIQVGESVAQPGKYFRNNVAGTLTLLEAMVEHRAPSFIFSSTAAIFGDPEYVPIDEDHPKRPVNPYGASKLMVEQMLADFDRAHGLRSVSLRYFNAAGAHPDGILGERHEPETHLIPLVLRAASGRGAKLKVFGTDYDTPDGTCIRDYVHIVDLCEAHLVAMEYLISGGPRQQFNLGNGDGFSVLEVIRMAEAVTGRTVPYEIAERRAGDAARLVADSRKAREILGWRPRYPDLRAIIQDAWGWEQSISR
jgi:UDP-glucose 4-epimerase